MTATKRILSNSEYHADFSAVSNSMLKSFIDDELQFEQWYVQGLPRHRKKQSYMDLGTAAHTMALEPEKWNQEVVAVPRWALSSGRRAGKVYKAFCSENRGKILLKDDEIATVAKMAEAILDVAGQWIRRGGLVEHSIYWTEPETRLRLKCRPDWLWPRGNGLILDVKTTWGLSAKMFSATFRKFKYGLQESHYVEGVKAFCGKECAFRFVVVQSQIDKRCGEHPAKVYRSMPADLAEAKDERRAALKRLASLAERKGWSQFFDA